MYCWQARRRLADLMEDGRGPGLARARAHVDACRDCREELRALASVVDLVGSTGRLQPASTAPPLTDPIAFEAAVFRRARAAARQPAEGASAVAMLPPSFRRWPRLAPVASAAGIMALAVGTALFVGTASPVGIAPTALSPSDERPDARVAAGTVTGEDRFETQNAEELIDLVAPPREIPFTIREDLVGARKGTIPVTTYVLEPAPVERAVMRASL